jgi:hypothetical protein
VDWWIEEKSNSLQSLLEKEFGWNPGMLKTRMALGWSLPLQKPNVAVMKLPWGEGMRVCWNG